MSGLVAPLPRNVKIAGVNPDSLKIVEGDVYNVCERIREISPDLRVVIQDGHPEPFVVMEDCRDGEVRMVSRYAELDARILEDLRRMRAIPFEERFRKTTERIDRENAARDQAWKESEEFDEFAWTLKNAIREANL